MNEVARERRRVFMENLAARIRPAALTLAAVLLCVGVGILAVILWQVHRSLKTLPRTLELVQDMARETTQTIANLRHVTNTLEANSKAEVQDSAAALTKTNAVLDSAQGLIDRTNGSLNSRDPENLGVLPELAAAVATDNGAVVGLTQQAGSTMAELGPVMVETAARMRELAPILQNTAEATGNFAKLSADPDLSAAIHEAAVFGANMDTSSLAWAATSKDVQAFVHRQTAPARWFVTLGKDLAGLGVSAYGVAPK